MNKITYYDAMDLRAIENAVILDANESIYFARQLEQIRSKSYDIKRAALSAITLMPIDTSINPGAEFVTYRQYDSVGVAKIIANYADDLPRADVVAKEFTSPVRGIGNSYGFSVQEIRAAQFTGTDLTTRKSNATRRAHDEKVNSLAWTGDSVSGLPGFLTNANIPGYTIPADGTGSSKLFSTKTPDQILRDMNGVANAVFVTTKGVHRPNEMWMDQGNYTYISSTPRSSTSDTTILEYFLTNNPFIERVIPVLEVASTANGGLNGSTNTLIALENSADNFTLNLPMMFMQHPPEKRGLEFVIPCESRFAGVSVYYPLSICKADSV